jgi:hypothetical protein
MVNGNWRLVNGDFLLQFIVNDLPLTFYESFRLLPFAFCLLPVERVPTCRRAGLDFQQTRFGQRGSRHEPAAPADQAGRRDDLGGD